MSLCWMFLNAYPSCNWLTDVLAEKIFSRFPQASFGVLCSRACDQSHKMPSCTRLGLVLVPTLGNPCVSALLLHHLLLPCNSNTDVREGTGASCMAKMHSFSCRGFPLARSYLFLCPFPYHFVSKWYSHCLCEMLVGCRAFLLTLAL